MNDRELLERAAAASGKDLTGYLWVDTPFYTGFQRRNLDEEGWDLQVFDWNPLVDWGQALQVAAMAEIDVNFGKIRTVIYSAPIHTTYEIKGNYMAEVCRAIVTTVAECIV